MLTTIEFNNEFGFMTVKINNIMPDNLLS